MAPNKSNCARDYQALAGEGAHEEAQEEPQDLSGFDFSVFGASCWGHFFRRLRSLLNCKNRPPLMRQKLFLPAPRRTLRKSPRRSPRRRAHEERQEEPQEDPQEGPQEEPQEEPK